ncbi:MAG TPA: AgmX/PglI C-terminal domain-containing protein [Gemmatimonadaceae bacterium]|nr:AgmX/PglI C-terminal domain-containing protein [Gemmatimonadaceae bacterium]
MSSAVTPNDPRPPEPTPVPTHGHEEVLGRSLRYEIAGEEGRALLASYALSFALGIAWLAFVYFGPRTLPMQLLSQDERPIAVTFDMPEPTADAAAAEEAAAAAPPVPKERSGGARQRTANPAAIAEAFGSSKASGGLVGDVSNVLRNVDVSSGSGGTAGSSDAGRKVVLGAGEGGSASRTPGRGGIGNGLGPGAGIGTGAGGGTVSRTPVRIAPPRPVDVPRAGGPQRDVSELGTFVRGHEAQLRFCYNEYGLKENPSLAGSITASVALTPSGAVTAANVTNRTWSGAGAAETERCIIDKIRTWRFPASEAGDGTFSFSFSFTR